MLGKCGGSSLQWWAEISLTTTVQVVVKQMLIKTFAQQREVQQLQLQRRKGVRCWTEIFAQQRRKTVQQPAEIFAQHWAAE